MRGFYSYYILESYQEDSLSGYEYKYQVLFGRNAFGEDFKTEQLAKHTELKVNPVLPPILEKGADRNHLKTIVQENLKLREQGALENYRVLFPYLAEENLKEDYVSILKEDWMGFPSGTVTYVRTTNLGKIVFFIDGVRIDPKTGLLDIKGIDDLFESYRTEPGIANNFQVQVLNTNKKTLLNAALTFSSYVSFLLPGGAAIAGLINALKMIFGGGQDLGKMIAQVLEGVFIKEDIKNARAKFDFAYQWFTDNQGGDKTKLNKGDYEQFKNDLHDRLTQADDIAEVVTNLMDGSDREKIASFPVFLSMAAFVILLLEKQLDIKSEEAGEIGNSTALRTLVDTLNKYINYAQNVKDNLIQKGKIEPRLQLVKGWDKDYDPINQRSTIPTPIGIPGARTNLNKVPPPIGYLQDKGFIPEKKEHQNDPDSIFPDLEQHYKLYYAVPYVLTQAKKNSPKAYYPNTSTQQTNKKKYLSFLQTHEEQHYFMGSAADVQKIINNWKTANKGYGELMITRK